jgi:glycosyltransferase involved in cell wall biosynthesis
MIFSLLCTVYNRERFLSESISSVLAQTFQNWELVIWDDGSTDRSYEIAKEFVAKDSRILVNRSEVNCGRAIALQNAIRAAQGQWLGLIDSDDCLHPECLKEVAAIIDWVGKQAGLIYTDRYHVDMIRNIITSEAAPSPEICVDHDLIGKVPFHFQCWRRDVFDLTPGVDCSLNAAIDLDISLKMLELMPCFHLQKPLYYHRIHPDRISAAIDNQTMQALKAVRKAIDRRGLPLQADLKWQLKSIIRNGHPSQID